MRFKIKSGLSLTLLSLVILLAGCKGKEGDPGPAGLDGNQGPSFDKALSYGNVMLFLDGVSATDVPFKDTTNFRFCNGDLDYSSVYVYDEDEILFRLLRWSTFDHWGNDNYFSPYIRIEMDGSDTTYYFNSNLKLNVPLSDHTFFQFDTGWYNDDGSNFTDEQFDGFKYNSTTGKMYCRFSFTVPEGSNETGHDLKVSGIVDVKVYVDESD